MSDYTFGLEFRGALRAKVRGAKSMCSTRWVIDAGSTIIGFHTVLCQIQLENSTHWSFSLVPNMDKEMSKKAM
jgi:hypothetical protein